MISRKIWKSWFQDAVSVHNAVICWIHLLDSFLHMHCTPRPSACSTRTKRGLSRRRTCCACCRPLMTTISPQRPTAGSLLWAATTTVAAGPVATIAVSNYCELLVYLHVFLLTRKWFCLNTCITLFSTSARGPSQNNSARGNNNQQATSRSSQGIAIGKANNPADEDDDDESSDYNCDNLKGGMGSARSQGRRLRRLTKRIEQIIEAADVNHDGVVRYDTISCDFVLFVLNHPFVSLI